jgi:DNA-binding HxlR family transcriptional regulator
MSDGPTLYDKWLVMGAIMDDPQLSDSGRRVAYALLNEQRDRGCYPGYNRLLAYTRLSRKGLQKALDQLEYQGWITRTIGSGRGNSTRYSWAWSKGEAQYALLMQRVEAERANARSQKGERTFPKRANASTPESPDKSLSDAGRARARAGAAAGAGKGSGGKASTSPANVPADTPKARQGGQGSKQQRANDQATADAALAAIYGDDNAGTTPDQRANGPTDPDQVRSDLVAELAQAGEYLSTYGLGAREVADQDLERMERACGQGKAHMRLRSWMAHGVRGEELRQAVERFGDQEGVAG